MASVTTAPGTARGASQTCPKDNAPRAQREEAKVAARCDVDARLASDLHLWEMQQEDLDDMFGAVPWVNDADTFEEYLARVKQPDAAPSCVLAWRWWPRATWLARFVPHCEATEAQLRDEIARLPGGADHFEMLLFGGGKFYAYEMPVQRAEEQAVRAYLAAHIFCNQRIAPLRS